MEEHQPQSSDRDILVKIHNQLVDIKKLLVETQLARPDAPSDLQARLSAVMGAAEYIETGERQALGERERKVIAPTSDTIEKAEPGEVAGDTSKDR